MEVAGPQADACCNGRSRVAGIRPFDDHASDQNNDCGDTRDGLEELFGAAAVALALASTADRSEAQDYPTRTITLVIPFAPGGSTSIVGRVIADKIEPVARPEHRGRQPSGGRAARSAPNSSAKSDPDGYTLLLGYTGTLAIGPSLYKEVGYNPRKDFAPIGMIGNAPSVLVVHPSFPRQPLPS